MIITDQATEAVDFRRKENTDEKQISGILVDCKWNGNKELVTAFYINECEKVGRRRGLGFSVDAVPQSEFNSYALSLNLTTAKPWNPLQFTTCSQESI